MAVTETIMVEPEAGTPASFLGMNLVIKIRGEQTSGAFSIIDFVGPPGFFVPPHVHEGADEVSYILEGELGVMVAEEEFQARPGSFVVRPRGVPHALWNVADRPVRTLDIHTPAGFVAAFEELSRVFAMTPPMPFEQRREVARRNDIIFLPELAPALVKKYGLQIPG